MMNQSTAPTFTFKKHHRTSLNNTTFQILFENQPVGILIDHNTNRPGNIELRTWQIIRLSDNYTIRLWDSLKTLKANEAQNLINQELTIHDFEYNQPTFTITATTELGFTIHFKQSECGKYLTKGAKEHPFTVDRHNVSELLNSDIRHIGLIDGDQIVQITAKNNMTGEENVKKFHNMTFY